MNSTGMKVEDGNATIQTILAEVLEVEVTKLEESGRFYEDYGADSLAALEILSRIEVELGVEVPETELFRIVSLASLRQVVAEYQGAPRDGDA